MNSWVIAMMLGASIMLGALGLLALIWGLKSGQFDDKNKFLDGALYDNEESLQDAIMLEKRKKDIVKRKKKEREKGYQPPD